MWNSMTRVFAKRRLVLLSLLALFLPLLWRGRLRVFDAALGNARPLVPAQREIDFSLPTAGLVSINILGKDGTLVRRLVVAQHMEAGAHATQWDGRDDHGQLAAPATYKVMGLVAQLG